MSETKSTKQWFTEQYEDTSGQRIRDFLDSPAGKVHVEFLIKLRIAVDEMEASGELVVYQGPADDPAEDDPGFFWHKGFIKPEGGTEQYRAWLLICQNDGGEHWDTIVEIDRVLYLQSRQSDSLKKMGIFPYKYRLLIPSPGDVHGAHQY